MQMLSVFAASAVALALSMSAATATVFSGASTGQFIGGQLSNACLYDRANGPDAGVAWGQSNSGACPDFTGAGQDSRLFIQGFNFSEDLNVPSSNKVQVGQIGWTNRRNNNTFDGFVNAVLELSLTSPTSETVVEPITFNIRNSANQSLNTSDLIIAADFEDYGLPLPYQLGGSPLSITEFSFELLFDTTGETLTLVNGGDRLRWRNAENNTSALGIYAHVAAVPLPSTGLLLLTALGGAATAHRRRKAVQGRTV